MIIALIGESCTGKSAIAGELKRITGATVFTGRDYLKLSKNENDAKKAFKDLLKSNEQGKELLIYVISEKEHIGLLPEKAFRILCTAELNIIEERFAKRMNGKLPPPVAIMLKNKHGIFDNEKHDLKINGCEAVESICEKILEACDFFQM